MTVPYPFKQSLFLLMAIAFFPAGIKAQNWSPFQMDGPNYFLLPGQNPIPGARECISLRFDTILQTLPLPTYRKAWPNYPEELSGIHAQYQPWQYFGTLYIPDLANKKWKLLNKKMQGLTALDSLQFRLDSLVFISPGVVGDTALTGDGVWGRVETKRDSLIEGQADSIAIIRLHGSGYEGESMVWAKNIGVLELPSFSKNDLPQIRLKRHFEGPGKRFDFMASDHPQWAPGDELHFISVKDNIIDNMGTWPTIDKYTEKRVIRCLSNGSGGIVFSGTFSSTAYFQNSQLPGTTTTITDSVYAVSSPPTGLGVFEYAADSIALNESTYGKISLAPPMVPSSVRCLVLPGNLGLKFYTHTGLDGGSIPLRTFPPFSGGTLGQGGIAAPPFQFFVHSYPVFYKFGNDSAGVRLPLVSKIQDQVKNGIRLFPNPASTHCFITCEQQNIEHVIAIDMGGKPVYLPFDAQKNQLDVRKLSQGLFVLEIKLTNGSHIRIRFQKV